MIIIFRNIFMELLLSSSGFKGFTIIAHAVNDRRVHLPLAHIGGYVFL
jgi:hypothetical protein